jgi:hypothetical protein
MEMKRGAGSCMPQGMLIMFGKCRTPLLSQRTRVRIRGAESAPVSDSELSPWGLQGHIILGLPRPKVNGQSSPRPHRVRSLAPGDNAEPEPEPLPRPASANPSALLTRAMRRLDCGAARCNLTQRGTLESLSQRRGRTYHCQDGRRTRPLL